MADIIAETDRLILRTIAEGDAALQDRLLNTPIVMERLGGVKELHEIEAKHAKSRALYAQEGFSFLMMIEKETGELVGHCGIKRVDNALAHNLGDYEVGWLVREDRWRRGYAEEAMRAVLDWAFGRVGAPFVVALTSDLNVASWKLMEKLGMRAAPGPRLRRSRLSARGSDHDPLFSRCRRLEKRAMTDRPGIRIIPIHGKTPKIHESAFIAPGCTIIGDVTIGADSSIWYNCVLRADVSRIVIGERSNVQDGSILHCDPPRPDDPEGSPLIIGDDVLIGHMAMVHGCTIHDRGFVGLGAIAMNKAVIGSEAMLAAGAMLTENKVMGERELWGGRPARLMRELDEAALMGMRLGVMHYAQNARDHAAAIAHGPHPTRSS